jgi:hypothetical protein
MRESELVAAVAPSRKRRGGAAGARGGGMRGDSGSLRKGVQTVVGPAIDPLLRCSDLLLRCCGRLALGIGGDGSGWAALKHGFASNESNGGFKMATARGGTGSCEASWRCVEGASPWSRGRQRRLDAFEI